MVEIGLTGWWSVSDTGVAISYTESVVGRVVRGWLRTSGTCLV